MFYTIISRQNFFNFYSIISLRPSKLIIRILFLVFYLSGNVCHPVNKYMSNLQTFSLLRPGDKLTKYLLTKSAVLCLRSEAHLFSMKI